MRRNPPSRVRSNNQRGYILIAILFVLTVMIIVLTAAAPGIFTTVRRDREDELIRRGRQYTRAIQLYYRKFGRFPSSIEQLENTNNVRFLRRKYKDPITGKDEWKMIHLGEAKPVPRPAYLSPQGGQGRGGATGGQSIGVSASSISRPLGGSSSIGTGPIVGIASTSELEAIKELNSKTHYNEWEFVYDPSLDPLAVQPQQPQQGGRGGVPQRGPGLNPGGIGPPPPPPPPAPIPR